MVLRVGLIVIEGSGLPEVTTRDADLRGVRLGVTRDRGEGVLITLVTD